MEMFGRPLTERLVLYIVHEVLEALAYAHHRTDANGQSASASFTATSRRATS